MSTPRTHLSLDGTWTLSFDPAHVGLDERWFENPPETSRELQLPTMRSQAIEAHGGVGWYFKTIDYDDAWQDRFLSLRIGATCYPATVWLNGTRLGDHVGGGTPVEFPVGAHFQAGSNLLAIRIALFEEEAPDGEVTLLYPLDVPVDVALYAMAKAHVERVYVQPDIRRKRLKVMVEAPTGATIHLQIEGTTYHVEGEAGELTLEFPEFICWSPATPELYTLRADLIAADGTVDTLSTHFAMREFTVKDERFYLNNRPLYVKCVSYVPQYPQNLKADKFDVLLKREMKLLKDGGFNTLRVCGAPAPDALLDLADTMGILVFAELASPESYARTVDWEAAVEALILRDRNRAAVVAWCGSHVPCPDAEPSARVPESCAREVRGLDPSRLILCDVSQDTVRDGCSAALLRPYREGEEPYESFEATIVPPLNQLAKDYFRLSGDSTRLNYQRCLGAGACAGWEDGSKAGPAHQQAFEAVFSQRELERCFGSLEKFYEASQTLQANALRMQLDAVRSNVKIAGYEVESLCDGPATAPFGLADSKRQAKPALKSLAPMQQELRPVIQMYKTNLVPREEVGVTILLINESRLEGRGELSLQVVGPTNQVLWKKKRLVKIPRHGRELWSGEIAASGSPGPHRFVVRLMQERRVVGENAVDLHVVESAKADAVEVNVIGNKRWRTGCAQLAKLHNFLAPIHIVPPLANTIRAYPANDLIQVMAQVYEGAVAIVFSPPEDWNDLTEYVGISLKISSCAIADDHRLNHHYAKMHPVFEGLPSRDLMGQPYQSILPLRAFESDSDEEMSGVHSVWREGKGDAKTLRHWWGNNITVKRLGAGRVVFTHLRILENLGTDPVADRLFVNLLQHFSRRSIPGTEVVSTDQKVVEWLRRERQNEVRKWMLIGSFPNWDGQPGHDTAYPPESAIELDATYPGWYRALSWKPWTTLKSQRHTLDFTAALDSDFGSGEPCPYGTAYAYAEFSSDRREEIALNLEGCSATKAWLNSVEIHASDLDGYASNHYETVLASLKQGKNTLLIKCSKRPGPFALSVEIEATGPTPLLLNWWK